jgi:hypothetical protein
MPVISGMTAALTLELSLRYLVGIKPPLNVRIRRCQLRESQARKEHMRGLLGKIVTALSSSILLVLPCLRLSVPTTNPRHGRCYRILPSTQHDAVRHQILSVWCFPPALPSLGFAT